MWAQVVTHLQEVNTKLTLIHNFTLILITSEGCVLTQKRKNDISEDNGTTLKKRCNDNAAIGENTNIPIPLGKHDWTSLSVQSS